MQLRMKQELFAVFTPQNLLHNGEKWQTFEHLSLRLQFRGTIYNAKRVAKMLHLPLESDPTLLLAEGYRRWETKLFEKLDAIFVLAIDDLEKNCVTLARDPVGIEQLYYLHDRKTFIFSSSLSRVANDPSYKKSLNMQALANYFTYGYIMQPNTIYRNCFKLKAGTYLQFQKAHGTCLHQRYWNLGAYYDKPKHKPDTTALKAEAKSLLKNAVQKRLDHTKNIAVSLSSGYDSSCIAALVQEQTSAPVKTFTIGFEETTVNEAPDAKKIAAHLGTEHTEYYFTNDDAYDAVTALSDIYDEPFYNNGAIPTTILAKLVKQAECNTVFVGDGGDEVFATADDVKHFSELSAIPYGLRRGVGRIAERFNPHALPGVRYYKNFPAKYYKMLQMFQAETIPHMVRSRMTLFTPSELQMLFLEQPQPFRTIFDELTFGPYAEPVDLITGSYFQSFMIDGELMKTTGAFSNVDIAVREPFLDKALIAFMAQVPSEVKIKNGIKKYLLKEIIYDYIPRHLLDRPKRGFSIPFAEWMRGILKPLLLETLSESNIAKDAILNPHYVKKIQNLFFSGKDAYKYKLWSIFLYQLWYEKKMRS
jgi:asparagine synthase (glutamine-hydrolysing)